MAAIIPQDCKWNRIRPDLKFEPSNDGSLLQLPRYPGEVAASVGGDSAPDILESDMVHYAASRSGSWVWVTTCLLQAATFMC